MEPDLCPPYWPAIIWWILHHPRKPGPDPGPLVEKLDVYFAAIAVSALAGNLGDKKIAEQIRQLAAPMVGKPAALAEIGVAR